MYGRPEDKELTKKIEAEKAEQLRREQLSKEERKASICPCCGAVRGI